MDEEQRRRGRRPQVIREKGGHSPDEQVYGRGGGGEAIRQWNGS